MNNKNHNNKDMTKNRRYPIEHEGLWWGMNTIMRKHGMFWEFNNCI